MLDQLVFNLIYSFADNVAKSKLAVNTQCVKYMREYTYSDREKLTILATGSKFLQECARSQIAFNTDLRLIPLCYNFQAFMNFRNVLTDAQKQRLCYCCVVTVCENKPWASSAIAILKNDVSVRKYMLDRTPIGFAGKAGKLQYLIKETGFVVTHHNIRTIHGHFNNEHLPAVLECGLSSADIDGVARYMLDNSHARLRELLADMVHVPDFMHRLYYYSVPQCLFLIAGAPELCAAKACYMLDMTIDQVKCIFAARMPAAALNNVCDYMREFQELEHSADPMTGVDDDMEE